MTLDTDTDDQLAEARELSVQAVGELLGWLVKSAPDLRAVGETLVLFLCATRSSHAVAKSARQLAPWLGVSHVTAAKRLKKLSTELSAFTGKQREKRTNAFPLRQR